MKKYQALTLIEMAIVLLLISILIGGFLIPLSAQIDKNRIKATQETLETIKEALIGFAVLNGRLPCSDTDNDGIEDACNTEGDLPWRTLALGKSDAWGQPFRYRVDAQYTTYPLPNPPNTSSNLKIRDRKNNALTNESVNSGVIALVISLGKDAQANDQNGGTIDNIYTQDAYVENTFDDILVWLPKTILINRLVAAERWP